VSITSWVQWLVSGGNFKKTIVGNGHDEVDHERLLTGNELGSP